MGSRLFAPTRQCDVRNKTVNVRQILDKMGVGKNGLYIKHLPKSLQTPGLPLEQVFKRVLRGVEQDINDNKSSWTSSSFSKDLFFRPEIVLTFPHSLPILIDLPHWSYCFFWSFPIFIPSHRDLVNILPFILAFMVIRPVHQIIVYGTEWCL